MSVRAKFDCLLLDEDLMSQTSRLNQEDIRAFGSAHITSRCTSRRATEGNVACKPATSTSGACAMESRCVLTICLNRRQDRRSGPRTRPASSKASGGGSGGDPRTVDQPRPQRRLQRLWQRIGAEGSAPWTRLTAPRDQGRGAERQRGRGRDQRRDPRRAQAVGCLGHRSPRMHRCLQRRGLVGTCGLRFGHACHSETRGTGSWRWGTASAWSRALREVEPS